MGNAASSVPYGAQSNTANISLTCSYNPDGYSVYDTTISLTTPLSGGAGQQFNVTDITAKIVLPVSIAVSILDSSATSYTVNTSITFDATNASPQDFVVNEYNTRHNVSYQTLSQNDLTIAIPASGETTNGVLAPVGPITLGTPGQTDFRLQSVQFSLQAYLGNGLPLFRDPAQISCKPNPEYILASIVVDNSPIGPLLAPANNAPINAPPTALGQHSTTASIPVNCTQNLINPNMPNLNYTFNYTFSATAPLLPANGVPFNLTNVNNYLTVPGMIAAYSTALYRGTCGLFVRLKQQNGLPGLGISFVNAVPGSKDASYDFVASDSSTPNPLVTGRYVDCQNVSPVQFPLPNLGSLNLTGIVASNQTGSVFSVSFDDIQGNIEGDNTYFGYAGSGNWICTPLVKPLLLSSPIV